MDDFLLKKQCSFISEVRQISRSSAILFLKIIFIAKISLSTLQFSGATALLFQNTDIMLSNILLLRRWGDFNTDYSIQIIPISIEIHTVKSSVVVYLWDSRNEGDNHWEEWFEIIGRSMTLLYLTGNHSRFIPFHWAPHGSSVPELFQKFTKMLIMFFNSSSCLLYHKGLSKW